MDYRELVERVLALTQEQRADLYVYVLRDGGYALVEYGAQPPADAEYFETAEQAAGTDFVD